MTTSPYNHLGCGGCNGSKPLTLADRELIHGHSFRQSDDGGRTSYCTACLADLPAEDHEALFHVCGQPQEPVTMQLYDAGIGDIITMPGHHPAAVTVLGYSGADVRRGEFTRLSWQGTGNWSGWRGTSTLTERALVGLVYKAGPDDPVRKQAEADLEAAFAAMLADEEG